MAIMCNLYCTLANSVWKFCLPVQIKTSRKGAYCRGHLCCCTDSGLASYSTAVQLGSFDKRAMRGVMPPNTSVPGSYS